MSQLFIHISKRRSTFNLQLQIDAPHSGITALFGRSGCGKSTTVNLIAGLLRPDSGRIQLGDVTLFDSQRGIDMPAEQRRIGYVFQNARLFPHYSVEGNLRYGLQRSDGPEQIRFERIVALLGLQTLLKRPPRELSGGEQQRVALGRALLSQPRLLLLDEPLASLDQARRDEVLPYLELIRDELRIPMVYVSHQFEEVLRLASHVVLLDKGQVLAQGTLTELSLQPEMRGIIGAEATGAVIEASVENINAHTGLAQLGVGQGKLRIDAQGLRISQRVRLQLLARDLILALQPPIGLSVRNQLQGFIVDLSTDDAQAMRVSVDVGGVILIARITHAAAQELQLQMGLPIWVLVKAITLRGHTYHGAA
ncbi:MAG: molybdenum ABC transporter ATP-binding protein [Steroidobacteraceae bacterium]